MTERCPILAIPPTSDSSLSDPSGPSVPESRGVRASVPGRECPETVPSVSPKCPEHLFDTPGHSQYTFF